VAEAIPAARLRTHPDYADAADPHLWMDPLLWAECAVPVAALLGRLVSGLDTARSLGALQAEYAKLDAYGRAALAPIPPARRILVTAHDAFSYFGARFGLEVQSIQGLSTEAEASLSRIEALVALMVERRVPAIFAEASVPDRAVRALIEGAGGARPPRGAGRLPVLRLNGPARHPCRHLCRHAGPQHHHHRPRARRRGAAARHAGPAVTPPLAIHGLSVSYNGRAALRDVTWDARPGLTAILGPNGAGKSTLLKAALGLIGRESGEARFFGEGAGRGARPRRLPAAARQRGLGFPGHRPRRGGDGPRAAHALVGQRAPRAQGRRADRARRGGARRLRRAPDRPPFGGQQQRVFLARALAQEADLFLMDEPLAAVDAVTERTILGVLHGLARQGNGADGASRPVADRRAFRPRPAAGRRVVAAGTVREAFTEENVGARPSAACRGASRPSPRRPDAPWKPSWTGTRDRATTP
jgi:energy-coupling factor transporter ATP-binding protein EcfA2